ncbi:MAG TPA: SPOR domain-containing protein [Kiloniellales bacterium]
MCRPAPTVVALVAVVLLAAGCGGRSSKPVYELPPPAPPGEDKPVDEVSENLALALGLPPNSPASLEERRSRLPKELVGDQQNADYTGERLTGSAAAATPAPPPAAAVSTAAVPTAPAAPQAPEAAPRVPVVRQPAPPPPVPAAPPAAKAPVAAPVAPAAPSAVVANAAAAGRVTAQIASFRTRANAEGGWQRLRAAHPGLLGDRALILQEADLGDRGIYYRVRTGPFPDTAAAKDFCARLRARDQACVVISPQ